MPRRRQERLRPQCSWTVWQMRPICCSSFSIRCGQHQSSSSHEKLPNMGRAERETMPKTRNEIGRTIAVQLAEFETSLDHALHKGAALLAALPIARLEARLAVTVGQDALERVIDSITAISAARRAVVEGHLQFESIRQQLGLPVHATGDKGVSPGLPAGALPDIPEAPARSEARQRRSRGMASSRAGGCTRHLRPSQ